MTEQGMSRGEWIRWLGEAISTECEKPFEEIDYNFVEECGRLLDELMESTATIPTEELRERLAKVNPGAGSGRNKKTAGNHRRLWTIAIAAAVVLCMSITVLAVPAWRAALLTALRLDVGASVEDNGIVYMNAGEIKHYENMDDLISTENLDILSFEDTTGELKIQSVAYVSDKNTIAIIFNATGINFQIFLGTTTISDSIKNNSAIYSFGNVTAYIFAKDAISTKEYCSYFSSKNNIYSILCPSEEMLLKILHSLKQGE